MKKRLFSYLLCISLLLGLPVSAATDSVTYTPSGTVTMIGVDTPLPVELRSVYDYESLGIASDYHTMTAANGSFSFDPITFTKEGTYTFELFTPPVQRLTIVCNCGEWFWAEDPGFAMHNAMHGINNEPDNYSSVVRVIGSEEVQVGSHEEDHGHYESVEYTDYMYCECGATK